MPSESRLLVGLWDLRKESETCDHTNRLMMGGANTSLLYIPRGVAHGAANLIDAFSPMIYFVNTVFDPKDPDEKRMPWDERGKDFWEAVRD
ncbi:dTDP-4-dehydrorhamnose 3,5-epimerase family protein [Candidatus Gottesmanbacteria bacterium]|nr:dTDP-4-dehydrorhamnose 3,5-epimerase family protein [Candidatus Gottesmanbacteria bacterium]